TGSANLTKNATVHQFNDLMVKNGVQQLYGTLHTLFEQLKRDRTARPIYWHKVVSKSFQVWVLPRPHNTISNDPIMRILGPVQCGGARGGTGINGRTKIRVSMHAWNGERGEYI